MPCCRVTRHTTLPLPLVESRTKFIFTVDPRANDVTGCPALFTVWAVVLRAVWSTMIPVVVPPTANMAVATLLLESITVTVWFPERPAGIVKYAMNAPASFGVAVVGTKLTIVLPTSTTMAEYGVNAFPMICTVEPTGPEVGVKVIVGGVKAKYEVAVLPDVSVTLTVLFAMAVNGTVNSANTLPPEPVVPAAAVILAPLTVTLKVVPEVAKPVP